MYLHRSAIAFAALTAAAFAAPLAAQSRSTADAAMLDAAVAAPIRSNRAVVASALTSSRALAIAADMGLNRQAIEARVASLDDAGAQKVADQLLAGGESTIVISTTAIIIALLLIILLTRL